MATKNKAVKVQPIPEEAPVEETQVAPDVPADVGEVPEGQTGEVPESDIQAETTVTEVTDTADEAPEYEVEDSIDESGEQPVVKLTPGQNAAATKAARAAALKADEESGTIIEAPAPKKGKAAKPAKVDPEDLEDDDSDLPAGIDFQTIGRRELAEATRTRMQDEGFGASPKIALAFVDCFIAAMHNAISAGAIIQFTGFGRFKPVLRKGGARKNPKTGEPTKSANLWTVSFKAGKALKDAVRLTPTS